MSDVAGQVAVVSKSPRGNISLKVEGDEAWYSLGNKFKGTVPKKGQNVTFSFSTNGDFHNIDWKTLEISGDVTTSESTTAPASTSKQPVDWDGKDNRIQFMSARNSAIEVVKLAMEQEALKLPAKVADKYDALLGYVDDLTNRYFIETFSAPDIKRKFDADSNDKDEIYS